MTGIYKITNKVNGKCYIGQSTDIDRRFREHRQLNTNSHLANAIRKYGVENFEFVVLEECEKDALSTLEIFYISLYGSTDPNLGYNLTTGGESGFKYSKDVIERLREKQKANAQATGYINPAAGTTMIHHGDTTSRCKVDELPDYLEDGWELGPSLKWRTAHANSKTSDYFKTHKFLGENNGFYGKHHSEETKAKIRTSMPDTSYNWRGKHHSDESKAKMRGPRPSVTGENNPNYGKRGQDSIMYGRRVMNNGSEEIRVHPDQIQHYQSLGYVLGRKPSMQQKMKEIAKLSSAGKKRTKMPDGSFKYITTLEGDRNENP